MIEIIVVMVLGMIIGNMLKQKKKMLQYVDNIVMLVIFFLLFFLGLSVGMNEVIVKNIHIIGFKALIITLSSGSVILSWAAYHFFFKRRDWT
ncbi:MAG: LysO family transporter [Deltaproteobacteria bacterium]|nr:LysO family transporter [Deltaproteobacteria bacterium]